jgi:hypothetical protein
VTPGGTADGVADSQTAAESGVRRSRSRPSRSDRPGRRPGPRTPPRQPGPAGLRRPQSGRQGHVVIVGPLQLQITMTAGRRLRWGGFPASCCPAQRRAAAVRKAAHSHHVRGPGQHTETGRPGRGRVISAEAPLEAALTCLDSRVMMVMVSGFTSDENVLRLRCTEPLIGPQSPGTFPGLEAGRLQWGQPPRLPLSSRWTRKDGGRPEGGTGQPPSWRNAPDSGTRRMKVASPSPSRTGVEGPARAPTGLRGSVGVGSPSR